MKIDFFAGGWRRQLMIYLKYLKFYKTTLYVFICVPFKKINEIFLIF